MYYELQPLRIQAGWKIQYNSFTEYDIEIHGLNDLLELNEDLLQLYNEKANLIIDLGWYPSHSIDGNYILRLVKNYKWDCPLEQITSKSKREIIACIEKWTCYDFFVKYSNRYFPVYRKIANPVEPVNGQDERHILCAAVDSPARLC